MGPIRTPKSKQHKTTGSGSAGPSKFKGKSKGNSEKESTTSLGVQKLKSSLRQTRRLLAKDNVAADVRVETERRLKALEADLNRAESARKERSLAVRYHKIKFFERQKVVRKLNQTKRKATTVNGDSVSSGKGLEGIITELRVDLNYILHYPKTKKYISLFPPEIRHDETTAQPSESQISQTNKEREEIRNWIRERMEKGELTSEPELHLDSKQDLSKSTSSIISADWEDGDRVVRRSRSKKSAKDIHPVAVESDNFFQDDESDDE